MNSYLQVARGTAKGGQNLKVLGLDLWHYVCQHGLTLS